jgi:hypothetical protein
VLCTSAPLLLYTIFVAYVTLSLSDRNAIGDQGAEALARGLPDSQITELDLGTLSVLQLYLVLFSSAPLLLYTIFVAYVTLSLSDCNAIGDQGAEALTRGLPDSQITYLNLRTLSALPLNLVLYTSAPLVLYSNFVPRVTLSLSGGNSIGDEGVTALAAALKDSSLSVLDLCTVSALRLNLELFTSAPLLLYTIFVAYVTLSLSDGNAIGDMGAGGSSRGGVAHVFWPGEKRELPAWQTLPPSSLIRISHFCKTR